jgi:hypothetical protein
VAVKKLKNGWPAGKQVMNARISMCGRHAVKKKNKAVRTWARGRVGAGLVWVGGAEGGLDD